MLKKLIFLSFFLIGMPLFSQEDITPTLRQKRTQEEINSTNLPPLPTGKGAIQGAKRSDAPDQLNVDSQEVVKTKKTAPNEGKPYFTLSAGLAPFQVTLGVLKYFIAEWWGQADLGVYFFPSKAYANYFLAVPANDFNPFIGFRISMGYAFYNKNNFELSLFATMQFAFISTVDIPIIFGGGFRLSYRVLYVDAGVVYSLTAGGTSSPIFNGVQPYIILGFRF